MTRVFIFSAGPAALPEEVVTQAAGELVDWHGSGQSVMEKPAEGARAKALSAAARPFRTQHTGLSHTPELPRARPTKHRRKPRATPR